jgi:ELMO domain-containing protein
MHASDIDSLQS